MFVGIVRENVRNTAKKTWILKKNVKNVKKRRSNNIYAGSPEDHGDHLQSVLLSFAQLQGHYILTKNEQFLPRDAL